MAVWFPVFNQVKTPYQTLISPCICLRKNLDSKLVDSPVTSRSKKSVRQTKSRSIWQVIAWCASFSCCFRKLWIAWLLASIFRWMRRNSASSQRKCSRFSTPTRRSPGVKDSGNTLKDMQKNEIKSLRKPQEETKLKPRNKQLNPRNNESNTKNHTQSAVSMFENWLGWWHKSGCECVHLDVATWKC